MKPSVSNGSFAHFSSCWEKWAVGDTFLMQKSLLKESYPPEAKKKTVDKKYAAGGKKIHRHVRNIYQGAASAAPKVRDG